MLPQQHFSLFFRFSFLVWSVLNKMTSPSALPVLYWSPLVRFHLPLNVRFNAREFSSKLARFTFFAEDSLVRYWCDVLVFSLSFLSLHRTLWRTFALYYLIFDVGACGYSFTRRLLRTWRSFLYWFWGRFFIQLERDIPCCGSNSITQGVRFR